MSSAQEKIKRILAMQKLSADIIQFQPLDT